MKLCIFKSYCFPKFYQVLIPIELASVCGILDHWTIMMDDADDMLCSIPYLDCRGYYDLAADIITSIAALLVILRALNNYRYLREEEVLRHGTEYGYGLARKMNINIINGVFLLTFLIHLVFSMVLFQIINEQKVTYILEYGLQLWYRFSEVIFVQLLNSLLLAVGWLHWKGLNGFYRIKEIEPPCIYSDSFQYQFIPLLILFFATIVISFVNPFTSDELFSTAINWLILISQIAATFYFLTFRLLYYRNIFCSVKLSHKAVVRERIYNFLIVISSLGRVLICMLYLDGRDFQGLRNYDSNMLCHDTLPYHGILLLFVGLFIDILPSFIFTLVFSALDRQNSEQTLFSALQSEYSSNI